MKQVYLLASFMSFSACAGYGFDPRSAQKYLGGARGDLRVVLHDNCEAAAMAKAKTRSVKRTLQPPVLSFSGIGIDLLSEVGGIGLKAFGNYIEEANKDDITRSFGSNGGLFYSKPSEDRKVTISPQMRCITLFRNALGPSGEESPVVPSADLADEWQRLNFTRTPDFYAELHIETAGELGSATSSPRVKAEPKDRSAGDQEQVGGEDLGRPRFTRRTLNGGSAESEANPENRDKATSSTYTEFFYGDPAITPPWFRIKLDRLYSNAFQSPVGTGGQRDLAIVFNYGLASDTAAIRITGRQAGVTELTGKYAIGAIRLPGLTKGYYSSDLTAGLQTAWMHMPGVVEYDKRATSDVTIDIVEFKPGNEMLKEIGTYLSEETTVNNFKSAIKGELDGSSDRADVNEEYTQRATEKRLSRSVQDKRLALEAYLKSPEDQQELQQLLSLRRDLEDSVDELNKQREMSGWITSLTERDAAEALLDDERLKF